MDILIDEFKPFKDNISDDANAINLAIDKCNKTGGGKVIITKGNYKASTIIFKSNVTLYLERDAKITLFDDLTKFKRVERGRVENTNTPAYENCDYDGRPTKFFIYAENLENIGLDGFGIINGNEEIFYGKIDKYQIAGAFYPRIPLIYFENSKNIKISNVTLERSAFWTVHLVGCEFVIIDKLTIDNNLKMVNCDGIDPDHSKHIRITNCNIKSADDCIVLKTTEGAVKYGSCSDIVVKNCILESTSAAIKIGTETCSDIFDVHFENIKIISSNRGISIMLRDLGNVYDCTFENIDMSLRLFSKLYWWGSAEGIALTALPRENMVGSISNIAFKNLNIDSENGILLYGENNISNIKLQDINLGILKKTDFPHENIDLRPGKKGLIESKFYALTMVGVKDVLFDNFNVDNKADYIKEIYNVSKSTNINFKSFKI